MPDPLVSPPRDTNADLARVLLAPGSIALYGASDDPTKTGSRPLAYLLEAGWAGRLYPVNARHATVQGHRAWRSLADLPEVPDHVFVLTGADSAVAAVRECVELGVPVVTVLASGFAEAGIDGRRRQDTLARTVAGTRTRVLGPSSLGVVDLRQGLVLTANAAFAEADLPRGGVFVASQSGSAIGALMSRGKEMGIGFAGLVSTGGELDLSLGEICSATLSDPGITSYALFLESLSDIDALRTFCVHAAEQGRPVVAYKLGRSQAAAQLAVSHTGALATDDVVASAALADLGIARVQTFEALLEAQLLAQSVPLKQVTDGPPRVGVVTTTGGGGAMVVDQLEVRGVSVAAPSADTRRRLAEVGIDPGGSALLDLTLAGTRYDTMKSALDVLLTAPEFDLVIAVVGSSARHHPELAVRPIAASATSGTPLAAFVVPAADGALRRLRAAGVAAFRTPESCADAAAAVFSRRQPRPRPALGNHGAARTVLDEHASAQLLEQLGVAFVPRAVLDVAEFDRAAEHSSTSVGASDLNNFDLDLSGVALPFPAPLVVKALSADLPHKSDAGGVVVGVRTVASLAQAVTQIVAAVRDSVRIDVRHVVVQPMVEPVGELLVGFRLDPSVGPIVMLAAGGVTAELYADRSVRPAPVDEDTAREMIGEVVACTLLDGYRGSLPGDLDAVATTIIALSHAADLADAQGSVVLEAEINPLMVLRRGDGALAVDGLVVLSRPSPLSA
jgi:acetate---CoA ligase (ADP-forming)